MCGGAGDFAAATVTHMGLSPRVRGSLIGEHERVGVARSIPACAGEPLLWRVESLTCPVYPRVCGGAFSCGLAMTGPLGLSPRVRGSHHHVHRVAHEAGSIPACAGEPSVTRSISRLRPVYPRVCGGADALGSALESYTGLSPRVRGSRRRQRDLVDAHGSIPACAGEPVCRIMLNCPVAVYPRVCGGAGSEELVDRRSGGSIPACAGEPIAPSPQRRL